MFIKSASHFFEANLSLRMFSLSGCVISPKKCSVPFRLEEMFLLLHSMADCMA